MAERRRVGIDLGIASAHTVRVLDENGEVVARRKAWPTIESLGEVEAAALAGCAAGQATNRLTSRSSIGNQRRVKPRVNERTALTKTLASMSGGDSTVRPVISAVRRRNRSTSS
jgi:hypothetical protein